MNLKKHISPHGRTTAVSMMKDEGPYVLEWFAHHFALGFTDILVYTNDCTDGTDDMLLRLEELGLGHHRRNDIPEGIKPQPSAIKYAQKEPIVQDSDWVILFDADEFLSIKYGNGTLDDVLTAAGDAHGIVITWRLFGSGGVHDWSRAPVTEQYTYAAPELWNKGWGVKTLFRFDHEKWKLGIHRPSMKRKVLETDYPDSVHWLNGSGKPMEDYFKFRGWRSIRRTVGYDWMQMNHYAVKSIDAYAVRRLRGNVNNKKDKYNADYWALQDRNEVKETSVLRHAEARAKVMTELLKDPVLNRLHFAAIEAVEAKLDAIKKTPAYDELKAGLITASARSITQVEAKPPKARDPAKIAALMSEVEAKSAGRPKQERRNKAVDGFDGQNGSGHYNSGPIDFSQAITVPWVKNHDVALPADPRVFTPSSLGDLENGKFDRRNARYLNSLLRPNDRFLNIGSGVGFIPVLACKTVPGVVVLAHEERDDLNKVATHIIKQNNANDTSVLKVVDGPLFFATDNDHQASGLQAYINDFQPTVIRIADPRITSDMVAALPLGQISRLIHAGVDTVTENESRTEWETALGTLGFSAAKNCESSGILVMDRARV
ncbi:MAG: glycosyltransferase family 2 protein [Planktomarina sp.]